MDVKQRETEERDCQKNRKKEERKRGRGRERRKKKRGGERGGRRRRQNEETARRRGREVRRKGGRQIHASEMHKGYLEKGKILILLSFSIIKILNYLKVCLKTGRIDEENKTIKSLLLKLFLLTNTRRNTYPAIMFY